MKKNNKAVLAAVIALGALNATSIHAQNQFSNAAGDGLWGTSLNWSGGSPPSAEVAWINVPGSGPATIASSVPSPSEFIVGQGAGDGQINVVAGGLITGSHMNLAFDGRSGVIDMSGGTMNIGELRMGRGPGGIEAIVNVSAGTLSTSAIQMSSRTDGGGPADANSFLTVSGGTVTSTGNLDLGHLGGTATMDITGGNVTISGNTRLSNVDGTSTATSHLNILGGTFHTNLIGVGATTAAGTGHLTIGGNSTVRTDLHMFLRSNGRGNITINGSNATIEILRDDTGTGFEVTDGSVVNFQGDAGGFSSINMLNRSTMRFSGPDGNLNIDATGVGLGLYDLFGFEQGYFAGDHNSTSNRFGTVNVNLADPTWSWQLNYNPNSIQFEVIPEPSTYAAIFGGLALIGVMIRRRFRN